jgi:thermitase
MWRYVLSFMVIVGLGIFVIAGHRGTEPPPTPEVYSTTYELSAKQTLLNQDVKLTDDLCRTQCSVEFHQMINGIHDRISAAKMLPEMKAMHEKMDFLVWSKHSEPLMSGTKIGAIQKEIQKPASDYMETAKQKVKTGTTYQSPQIGEGSRSYFVLGVPSSDGTSSLIGVIHQDILSKVADHQRKNLRLEPYPSDNKWKIESVETGTLRNKTVAHPEDNQNTSHFHKNEVAVRFKQDPTAAQLAQIHKEIGARGSKKLGYTYVFEADSMEAKQLLSYFSKWDIEYAEPHYLYLTNERMSETLNSTTAQPKPFSTDSPAVISPDFIPNDNLYQKYQWNLPIIETPQGWQVNRGASDVVVAIVDTGVDLNHPDLKDHLVAGTNIIDQKAAPNDDVGHGTHVAGVISAVVNNNIGVAGITWFNKVMPVKALDKSGAGSTYSVSQGIIWATDHGAKVINMSLGNYADSSFLHDAITYAFNHDVVLIAASGNDNTEQPGYPAAYPEVFAVAASDSNNKKAPFSNYGDYIDVTAPGVSIASTYPNNQYAALSGTSMASPHVTALAALIRSTNPSLKNTEVYEIMRTSARDLGSPGKDKYFGYGLIDVVQAVNAANGNDVNNKTNNSQTSPATFFADPLGSLKQTLNRFWNPR